MRRLLTLAVVLSLVLGTVATATASASGTKGERAAFGVHRAPKIVEKWEGAKADAADLVAQGEATVDAQGRVKLRNGRFVDYRTTGTDHIVTLLVEFGAGAGPLHNRIPQPVRPTASNPYPTSPSSPLDNSNYWRPDFNRRHYLDLMFAPGGGSAGITSTRDVYLEFSSGRYTVDGQVSNWIRVPQEEAQYGANSSDGAGSDNANGEVYRLIRDTFAAMKAQGTTAGVDWSSSVVDVWDRYDCDGDGNFDEADGYVDHFQLVHAGVGEEDDGGAQGPDAIWSHRWYANFNEDEGPSVPSLVTPSNPNGDCHFGGYATGINGLWVGDYTMEPENGGVGVFAHEFGHDLGLPDLYDTLGANDNSVSFWSIMSDGSNTSDDPNSIGTKPTHMGPWEKLVLGWLDQDLATVTAGQDKRFTLGPAEGRTTGAQQAIRIDLPDYSKTITVFPVDGSDPNYYYSDQGDDIDTTMRRPVAAPLSAATTLTFRATYDIEKDWDYAYVQYSTDNGATWRNANGNLSVTTDPNGQNFGFGITGTSSGWVNGTYTIPAGATNVGFRYWTDGAVVGNGFAVDSIKLGSEPVDTGASTAWTFAGFSRVANGQITRTFFHYYLVESRSYVRSDTALCGAYLFVTSTFVDKACYDRGVLVWYRNSAFQDNNVSRHPGAGQILPVDAHPQGTPAIFGKGYIRERWQTWDATFDVANAGTHSITLHAFQGGQLRSRTYRAAPVSSFVDSGANAYWNPAVPYAGVKTPGSGVRVDVLGVSSDGTTYQVRVR